MGPSLITPTALYTTYIAVSLQDILYGVELVLYIETVHAVLMLGKIRRADALHVLFSSVMFVLITILVSMNAVLGEDVCVTHNDYPGGESAYWSSSMVSWYMNLGRVAAFLLQLMADALLIHRCWAVWHRTCVIIAPLILWFAALALGAIEIWLFGSNMPAFLPISATQIALTYYTVCVVLNTALTSLIYYRIVRHGKLMRAEFGREYSAMYFSVAEIIVESALPFTLSGIALLISLGARSLAVTPLSWVYFMMTCISPQMLILWVQKRKALRQNASDSEVTSSGLNTRFRNLDASEVPGREAGGPEGTLHLRPLSIGESMWHRHQVC